MLTSSIIMIVLLDQRFLTRVLTEVFCFFFVMPMPRAVSHSHTVGSFAMACLTASKALVSSITLCFWDLGRIGGFGNEEGILLFLRTVEFLGQSSRSFCIIRRHRVLRIWLRGGCRILTRSNYRRMLRIRRKGSY